MGSSDSHWEPNLKGPLSQSFEFEREKSSALKVDLKAESFARAGCKFEVLGNEQDTAVAGRHEEPQAIHADRSIQVAECSTDPPFELYLPELPPTQGINMPPEIKEAWMDHHQGGFVGVQIRH